MLPERLRYDARVNTPLGSEGSSAMAPPRTFDYDLLKRLVRDHPGWPHDRYADVLTKDVRRSNPSAPRVLPHSISRVISLYRDKWQEEGVTLTQRGVVFGRLVPPLGAVAPSQRMATPLRYLREIAKQRQGLKPVTDNERVLRRQALRWEERMRENREIADISPNGIVVTRPAGAGELDDEGELIELAAWALPGYSLPRQRVMGRRLWCDDDHI